jgi:hypothetical protein
VRGGEAATKASLETRLPPGRGLSILKTMTPDRRSRWTWRRARGGSLLV